jgi:hypothetical protein
MPEIEIRVPAPLEIEASSSRYVVVDVTNKAINLGAFTTTNLVEGDNLYYTTVRANSAIDTRVTKAFIDALNVDADTLDGNDSTYFATASNLTSHTSDASNPHSVTATQVGLGNVTNESKATMFTNPVFTGNTNIENSLTVGGNLTVNGTLTSINSTTVSVDDKNLELGSTDTPTDSTANGGGITLKGDTDKTIIWDSAHSDWTSSENVNVASGKVFKVNAVEVLSATTLGSSVVSSSLTSVGTITSGTWNGTTIAVNRGGTGLTGYRSGDLLYASGTSTLSKLSKGTSGQFLQMNAAETAPEWTSILDCGDF